MKKRNTRNILILSILMVFIICIGAVSAVDTDNNQSSTDREVLTSQIDVEDVDDAVSASENDVLGDDDGSFTSLQNLLDTGGNVINLTKDYTWQATDNYTGLNIFKNNTVINGNGHVIDGKNYAQGFIITANNVTLKNIVMVNTTGISHYGAAINCAGDNLTVTDSTFSNNKAEDAAAVYFNGGKNVVISNSNFTNNAATSVNTGAVSLWNVENALIENCEFRNNEAKGSYGALRVNGVNVTLRGSKFIGNKANKHGGAVINAQNVTVSNTQFIQNSAKTETGAIHIQGGNATVVDSIFKDNSGSRGGAAYSISVTSFINCEFTNNSASGDYAGALYISCANCIISGSKFVDNGAYLGQGGAVVFSSIATNGTVFNSTFINNVANSQGGSLLMVGGGNIINSTFINNTAVTNYGGAIRIQTNPANISDCTFINNTATSAGAVNFAAVGSKIFNSTFIGNIANVASGAAASVGKGAEIYDCTFIGNTAKTSAGAVYLAGTNSIVSGSTFIKNSASNQGGAIFSDATDNQILTSKFINNTAVSFAADVLVRYSDNIIDSSIFINGISNSNGGSVCVGNAASNVVINNSTFINATGVTGGAIYIGSGTNHVVSYSKFINNKASNMGGGVYIVGANTTVSNSIFINNTGLNGGAVRFYTGANNGRVLDCVFINNTVLSGNYAGGALYISCENVTVSGSSFITNNVPNAGYAGAIQSNFKSTVIKCNAFIGSTSLENNGINTAAGATIESNWFGSNNPTAYSKGSTLIAKLEKVNDGDYNLISEVWNGVVKVVFYNKDTNEVVDFVASRPVHYTLTNPNILFTTDSYTNVSGKIYGDYNAMLSYNVTAKVDNQQLGTVVFNKTPTMLTGTSFSVLQLLIDQCVVGETLILDKNFTYVQGDLPVKINKTIKIVGNVVISGDNVSPIFNITANNVELSGLTIANANGRAVSVKANGTKFNGMAFMDNGEAVYVEGVNTVFNNVFAENSVFTIIGDKSQIKALTLNNIVGTGVTITGNNSAINGVNIIGGKGTSIDVTGDNTNVNTINADNHEGDVLKINGISNNVNGVTANNNVEGIIVNSEGQAIINNVVANNGTGTVVKSKGNDSAINAVTANNFTGIVVDATGNHVNVTNVLANNNTGDVVKVVGDYAYIDTVTSNDGVGDVVNLKGNYGTIKNINGNNIAGELYVIDGTGNTLIGVSPQDPEKAFFIIVNATARTITCVLTNMPTDSQGYFQVYVGTPLKSQVRVINGVAENIVITDVATGNYTYRLVYSPAGSTYKSIESGNVIVEMPKIPAADPENAFVIPATMTSSPTFELVGLAGDAGGDFEVYVDGVLYKKVSVSDGGAKITVDGLSAGNHNVLLNYTGDSKYLNMSKNATVTVPQPPKPVDPVITLSAGNVAVSYSGSATYSVNVKSDGKPVANGQIVVINFNGRNYNVATVNGVASLSLATAIKVGSYKITATYKGKTVTNTVTIKNIINANKLKKLKKSKKVTKVKVTLAKVNGKFLKSKKLILKIKGKKVATAKTNKKGVAIFKIKKKALKKFKPNKKYKATVTYGKDVVTKKIKITK